jgi:hypothetical protein
LHLKVGTPIIVIMLQGMLMNRLRLMATCAVVIMLLLSAVSASADESKISQTQTALSNTTISGYVITAITVTQQSNPGTPHVFRQRLYSFYIALRSQWIFILFRY